MLQQRGPISPLRAADQLPPVGRDLARQRIPKAGSCCWSGRGCRSASSADDGRSQRLKASCQRMVDPAVRIAQRTPGINRSAHRVREFLAVIDRPPAGRPAYDIYSALPSPGSIILAGRCLVSPEREASRLPFVEAHGDFTAAPGFHEGLVHGHVPCTLTGSVVDQSNHCAPITSLCDTRPRR